MTCVASLCGFGLVLGAFAICEIDARVRKLEDAARRANLSVQVDTSTRGYRER